MRFGRLLQAVTFSCDQPEGSGPLAAHYTSEVISPGTRVAIVEEAELDEGVFLKIHPIWHDRIHTNWTTVVDDWVVRPLSVLELLAEQAP